MKFLLIISFTFLTFNMFCQNRYPIVDTLNLDEIYEDAYRVFFITEEEIFIEINYKTQKLYKDTILTLGFLNDTIFDANFDGQNDYIIEYYSPAGCCPRNEYIVYLASKNSKKIAKEISLLNTYFDRTNNTLYQMSYGHIGETELTNSIWVEESLKVIETVWYDKKGQLYLRKEGKVFKIDFEDLSPNYKKIPGFSGWF